VVEDDPISQRILQLVLTAYGPVDVAANGRAAVQAYHRARDDGLPYDLICLDIQIPELDGITVLERLRRQEKERGVAQPVKVLITSAHTFADNIILAHQRTCDGFLAP
jgi:two-component system chemotaxis response regulator CheY